MSIASTTVWEVRTTGSDTNGGGFDPSLGGTDYTLQDAAQATGTATSASTTLTATTGIFTSFMVGNMVTNGSTWKQITAFTSSTVVTLDSAPTWTSQSISIGGALASPGMASGLLVANNTVYIKAGTYTFSASSNVSGGKCLNFAGGNLVFPTLWVGYTSTRTPLNTDVRPVCKPGANSVQLFNSNQTYSIYNVDFTNPSAFTSCGAVEFSSGGTARRIRVTGPFDTAFHLFSGAMKFESCEAISCVHGFFYDGPGATQDYLYCSVRNCTTNEPAFTLGGSAVGCLALGNPGIGFLISAGNSKIIGCVADGCTGVNGVGFQITSSYQTIMNCVSLNNSLWGFNSTSTSTGGADRTQSTSSLYNCAGYNNTSGNASAMFGSANNIGFITLTTNPFNNPGSLDYTLNSSVGGGAALFDAGFPSTIAGLTGTNYINVGLFVGSAPAVAGSLLYNPGMSGGMAG